MGGWGGMSAGLLPDPGGVNDQSSALMEAFMVVAEADSEWDRINKPETPR